MSESISGSPVENFALARTGKFRHVRRYTLGVCNALCDPTLRVYPDRTMDEDKHPVCRRCTTLVHDGTFDEVLRIQRLGRAS